MTLWRARETQMVANGRHINGRGFKSAQGFAPNSEVVDISGTALFVLTGRVLANRSRSAGIDITCGRKTGATFNREMCGNTVEVSCDAIGSVECVDKMMP